MMWNLKDSEKRGLRNSQEIWDPVMVARFEVVIVLIYEVQNDMFSAKQGTQTPSIAGFANLVHTFSLDMDGLQ